MGSYASLFISSFEAYSCKSYISPTLMTLFRESDRKQLSWTDGDGENRESFKYINRVGSIKLRLDIMGFNLANTIDEFTSKNDSHFYISYSVDDVWNEILYENYSFDNWLKALKSIVNAQQYYFELKESMKPNDDPILYHILNEHEDGNSLFGFKCYDIRYVIRGVLELFNDDEQFYIDFSELIDAGYYSEEDKICELSLQNLADDYIANEKIIILSEGSSDITIIKRTMEYLYPDIVGFYSFMDFYQSNASGSASSLVAYIKAFIGSGIRNRIIALFDNDTAADEAISALNKINVPSNIRVLRYPYLEHCNEYPTIGPHGIGFTNINGLACSVEMYLGCDMLVNNDLDYPTKLIPVQWKGYSQGLKKYQGEILNKEKLHKKYIHFLDDLNENPELKEKHDWEGMKAIIMMIFNAFNR
ncbi:HEPN/Toprim-associated domain-containing protein [Cohnella sp.]|uniref:HEPN/Toprim-associated domain-containing protein n=1 Tax=Cohnella sp. TaxID=1883426 RepID=UPI0035617EDE